MGEQVLDSVYDVENMEAVRFSGEEMELQVAPFPGFQRSLGLILNRLLTLKSKAVAVATDNICSSLLVGYWLVHRNPHRGRSR